jgi:hypothetical protein
MATKTRTYPAAVRKLMAEKTAILSKAHALSEMGMPQTAIPLWTAAASYEERLAPLLETLGREREAAVHRISAASCYVKAGELSRAANLFRAALAEALPEETEREVQQMLAKCLSGLRVTANGGRRRRKQPAQT